MKPLVTRAYNEFARGEWGTITKQSDTARLVDEIRYYNELPAEWKILFPRVLDYNIPEGWITMEWYDYPNLGEYMMEQMDVPLDYQDWIKIMMKLRDTIREWSNVKGQWTGKDAGDAWLMYGRKTLNENWAFEDQHIEPRLFQGDEILINDGVYKTFEAIWPEVRDFITDVLMPSYTPGIIHGDMCFSNILCGSDQTLRFIDPRGSFGEKGYLGDPRYDVAKLYHSVDAGYEFFNGDQFTLYDPITEHDSWKWGIGNDIRSEDLSYTAISHESKMRALSAFNEIFFEFPVDTFDKKEITIIEGLMYIGLCARHYENPRRQVAMYLAGLQLLNKGMKL